MATVVNMHLHISNETPGKKYFPWQQTKLVCIEWAYGGRGPTKGKPPFTRDAMALFPRQGMRFADPEGKYTIQGMDWGGVDMATILPIDYDLSWGSHSDITIEEKHQHQAELANKFPGRFIPTGGPDPRRAGAVEIFERSVKEYGCKGLKLIPKNGYYPWEAEPYELFKKCLDLGLPVLICTQGAGVGGGYNRARFADPVHLSDVTGDFPDMKIVNLHAGSPHYNYFEMSVHVAEGNSNCSIVMDLWLAYATGQERTMTPYGFPPGVEPNEETIVLMLAKARDVLGSHRIMWGTDEHLGPATTKENAWPTGGPAVKWLKRLPATGKKYGKVFTQQEVDEILGGNALRIMGVKPAPEWEMPEKYGYSVRIPRPKYS